MATEQHITLRFLCPAGLGDNLADLIGRELPGIPGSLITAAAFDAGPAAGELTEDELRHERDLDFDGFDEQDRP